MIKILAIFMIIIAFYLLLPAYARCTIIYGKNICNFYRMLDIATKDNLTDSDIQNMIDLCASMSDTPKKESCFEFIAVRLASKDVKKAGEICNLLGNEKQHCYNEIHKNICVDMCGDGICQTIVCMGTGCPCPETPENCMQDCVR